MTEPIAEVGHLAGVCGSEDGTDWEKILIDASRRLVVAVASAMAQECQLYGWDGDSWEKLQVDSNKYLKVTLPIEEALGARAYQYDGSTWRRSNLMFGYNDRYAEAVDELDAGAGGNLLSTTAVPANYVYVVNFISALNNTTNPSSITLMLNDGTSNYPLYVIQNPGAKIWVYVTPQAILKEGDFCRASIDGCVAGDDIYLRVWGYKMKINM